MRKKTKRFCDRYDGRYLKKVDPFYKIIPYIMKTRVDAQVFFEDRMYIDKTESFIKSLRKEKNIKIGFLHIVIAAMVRTVSQKPRINRFVSGRKIYARNEISVSLAVKKKMSEDVPETTIKVLFDATDTIYDVVEKVNRAILENKNTDIDNETDKVAKMIMLCPGFIIRILVAILDILDHHGMMPKFINKASPFHSSLFITDLGSIGIQPVFHHIYEFGTTSLFVAFGTKNKEKILDTEGRVFEQKFVDMKVVADERICDGFYFSRAFRIFRKLIQNPQMLMYPPKSVIEDNEI